MAAYATSRKLSLAGDWEWSTSGFAAPSTPATPIVLFTLRTTKGQCAALPTVGVEWPSKLGTNAVAATRTAIINALADLVRRRVIADVDVTTEEQERGRMAFGVSFLDVRAQARSSVRGVQP